MSILFNRPLDYVTARLLIIVTIMYDSDDGVVSIVLNMYSYQL